MALTEIPRSLWEGPDVPPTNASREFVSFMRALRIVWGGLPTEHITLFSWVGSVPQWAAHYPHPRDELRRATMLEF